MVPKGRLGKEKQGSGRQEVGKKDGEIRIKRLLRKVRVYAIIYK